jgi:hypothetical protein
MIRRLLARLCRVDRTLPIPVEPRGGGPVLDEDELHIEAAERGLTGRDRDDWIERKQETVADVRRLRIGDYFPDGKVPR